jgi:hypothetical protein
MYVGITFTALGPAAKVNLLAESHTVGRTSTALLNPRGNFGLFL